MKKAKLGNLETVSPVSPVFLTQSTLRSCDKQAVAQLDHEPRGRSSRHFPSEHREQKDSYVVKMRDTDLVPSVLTSAVVT